MPAWKLSSPASASLIVNTPPVSNRVSMSGSTSSVTLPLSVPPITAASLTGLTVISSVSLTIEPGSDVDISSNTAPLKSASGVNVIPSSAALTSDSVPLITKLALPSAPSTKVRPVICDSDNTPLSTVSDNCTKVSVEVKLSETVRAFPLLILKVSTSSSSTTCGPGSI